MVTNNLRFPTIQEIGDLSSEGVIIYCLVDRRVIYANAPAVRLTGLTENSTQSSIDDLLQFIIPEDRKYLKNRYSQVNTSTATIEVEFRIRKKAAEEMYICCNAYLISNKSCVVVNVRDISKPKQHENYLVEFGTKKNTLLDFLSHHTSGALSLMQHLTVQAEKSLETSDPQNLKKYLSLLHDNTKHCIAIIDELMKDEHVESPNIFVKKSRIDLVEKISFIYKELLQSYKNRNFSFTSSSRFIYINTDEVKILQVVNNLISNAIKFTPVTKPISVEVLEKKTAVVIRVSDEGIGIPENLKQFIFHRQSIAGRIGLNGEKSHGMGLSICKSLIQLTNGNIWFESEEGKGSSFYVSLPKDK